jgi:hypothetical protein
MNDEAYIESLYEATPEPEDYDDDAEFEDRPAWPSCWTETF